MFTIEVSDEFAAYDGERRIERETLREVAGEVEELTGLPYTLIRGDLSESGCDPITYDGLREGEKVTVLRSAEAVAA